MGFDDCNSAVASLLRGNCMIRQYHFSRASVIQFGDIAEAG